MEGAAGGGQGRDGQVEGLLQWNDITNAEREEFVKATAPVYQEFEPTIGKALLAQAIKALGTA